MAAKLKNGRQGRHALGQGQRVVKGTISSIDPKV